MDLDTIIFIIAIIALVIGIALALFGRAIWGNLLSMMGGMIGWMLGFGVGVLLFGFGSLLSIIIAIICGFIGSLIMGAIFGFLVELALALLTGILAAGLFYFVYGNIIIALIIFAVVFILAYVFIEKVVIVVTAFIGAIIAGVGIFFLMDNAGYAIIGALALLIGGILIQFFLLDGYDNFLY